jgi:pimeloyl-ACP methyl ester carboxylesterase
MFFKANGVSLYYEKFGQGGHPVILLHGNGESHRIFDVLAKHLSLNHTVYAIDSRDHGKSSKVKSLAYGEMMEDVAEFIRKKRLEKPILYGFSDGGIIGLLLVIQYPEIISKLIISGANTRPDGIKRRYLVLMKMVYFFTRDRKYKLMLTQPNITAEELKTITTPTIILVGSRDIVKEGHTRDIAEQIPESRLIILEGETHGSYVLHSKKLHDVMEPFLPKRKS